MTYFKAMTFNLKNDMIFTRSFLRWDTRREYVVELIRNHSPDIIGVQELNQQMKEELQALLIDYQFIGESRSTSHFMDEAANILIKKERFELITHQTFWLSKHPELNGTRNFTSLFPRICTMAEVKDKQTNISLRVFNTHLDHLLSTSRLFEIGVIVKKMLKLQEDRFLPLILMGDLNTGYKSKVVRTLTEKEISAFKLPLFSVYESDRTFNTLHYGSGKKKETKSPIDFIFVNEQFNVLETHIITTDYNGLYPSDHYPVMTLLEYK